MPIYDLLEYLLPYIKIVSKKGSGQFVAFGQTVLFLNTEKTQLFECVLSQDIQTTICMHKDNYLYILESKEIPEELVDYHYYYEIIDIYKEYHRVIQNGILTIESTLTDNDDFEDYKGMKVKDGFRFYQEKNLLLPFFYGILPITKQDIVSVEAYQINEYQYTNNTIVKYSIKKKKPSTILHIYMRLMNLQ